jgi:hypothetical protein
MLVAVPGRTTDVYERHQQVWQAVAPFVEKGEDFQFKKVDESLYRVRSRKFGRHGRCVPVPKGANTLRAALSRTLIKEGRQTTIADDELPSWFQTIAGNKGLLVLEAEFSSGERAEGRKACRYGNRLLEIRFETVHVKARVEELVHGAYERVLATGIGRGRRFGFGMIDLRAL